MKPLKYFLAVLSIIAVFLAGMWVFTPWENLVMYALDSSRLNAAKNGIYINYGTMAVKGRLEPEIAIGNFNVETPLAKISVANVEAKISLLQSLASLGAVFDVDFRTAEITMVPKNQISMERGHARLAISNQAIYVTQTDFKGDITVTGDAAYNFKDKKTISSTLLFEVPDDINSMLSNPMLGRYIESTEKGKWRIKHETQNK